ncbi:MAG: hypothetical protein EAZ12_01405 [Sphingobacteriia bacterium]|nr:MAG: hypothetical protein EAZ12_01405 [Sphingobacteriia bacterium]
MDEFKKYIQNNKEQLDEDMPSPGVWNNIEQGITPVKSSVPVVTMIRWAVAACVIALAGIGSWYLLTSQKPSAVAPTTIAKTIAKPTIAVPNQPDSTLKNNEVAKSFEPVIIASNTNKKQPSSIDKINTGSVKTNSANKPANDPAYTALLNNVEASFTQVINLQKARISTYPMFAESADYFKDFNIQIKQMEKEEKNIKSTISRRGISNDLLDQLINLYQQKLTILKQLQLEMNKTNNRFKQNRGPVDTTRTYFLSI